MNYCRPSDEVPCKPWRQESLSGSGRTTENKTALFDEQRYVAFNNVLWDECLEWQCVHTVQFCACNCSSSSNSSVVVQCTCSSSSSSSSSNCCCCCCYCCCWERITVRGLTWQQRLLLLLQLQLQQQQQQLLLLLLLLLNITTLACSVLVMAVVADS